MMKFVHLLPVLALAAAAAARDGSGHVAELAGPAAPAPATPPWLTAEGAEALASETLAAQDPHAEVCSGAYGLTVDGTDPHAGLCAGSDDPHAALHAAVGDPHAGLHAGEGETQAGLHSGPGDPHAGLHVVTGDPHAVAMPAPADDPYARVGLVPAPPVALSGPVAPSNAENGRNVAEIYAQRAALQGKRVRVRGTVVKLTEGILGVTYLHLRDGSGDAGRGDHDLTVTTTEPFQLGETVELEGELAIDRDVGAGYRYDALLTQAARIGA